MATTMLIWLTMVPLLNTQSLPPSLPWCTCNNHTLMQTMHLSFYSLLPVMLICSSFHDGFIIPPSATTTIPDFTIPTMETTKCWQHWCSSAKHHFNNIPSQLAHASPYLCKCPFPGIISIHNTFLFWLAWQNGVKWLQTKNTPQLNNNQSTTTNDT